MANFKVRRVDFWNAAIDWAEQEEEYPVIKISARSFQMLLVYYFWKDLKS